MLILAVAAGIIAMLFKPSRRIILSFAALIVLKICGLPIGVNLLNAGLCGLLGIPGIASVFLLNIIY